ncbi:uncharacterized protein LOC141590351 [Silene latifolia]|uniref:uncharacterized protein LOC141590351 n=1 Tax=Silene latifolia TaxID=37657 RepID=UPI003D77CABA
MGDFNVVRQFHEKISNTPPVFSELADFNSCLLDCGLEDLHDRVLVNSDWMQCFPQTSAKFEPLGISIRCPAVLTFHDDRLSKKQFSFLNCWTSHPDFLPIVSEAWTSTITGNPMFRLMGKLKRVRAGLKKLHTAHYSNIGQRILDKRKELTQCFEDLQSQPLSASFIAKERDVSADFLKLKEIENSILTQRAKLHDIHHNDTCSAYFFAKIKERQQYHMICDIQSLDGTLHKGPHKVGHAFVQYYEHLLGSSVQTLHIDHSIIANGACVGEQDHDLLIAPITKAEIKMALFSMGSNKSPGLDSLSAGFFKAAWGIVETDFCKTVEDFFRTSFMPKQDNVTILSLIPKKTIVQSGKDFRPTSCCSIIYKTISKILTNRLQTILPKLIGEEQEAFVKGRSLFNNIMLTQGLLKGYDRKNLSPRCMLKVDISKSFDSLQWQFIQDMLRSLKFPPLFISWIMGCITGPWFTIKVNGANFSFFKGKSGVRQGDPLSPSLFILNMEILSRCFRVMCKEKDVSFHPKCVKLGVNHLIFADDPMVFTRGDLPSVYKAAKILHLFSTWSGLVANFDKTESMYEGLTLKITGLLNRCSDKHLSYAGRLQTRKMSFKSWSSICSPWSEGGFQLKNIASWNRAVLLKWLWHIERGTGSVWSRWIRALLLDVASWTGMSSSATQLHALLAWVQHSKLCNWKRNWALGSIAATVYVIWCERNRRIFEGHDRTIAALLRDVQFVVSATLLFKTPLINHEDIIGALVGSSAGAKLFLLRRDFKCQAYHLIHEHGVCFPLARTLGDSINFPKHVVVSLLALQNKLSTIDNLCARGLHLVNRCALCESNAECRSHLFFICPFSSEIWLHISHWLHIGAPNVLSRIAHWFQRCNRGQSLLKRQRRCAFLCAMYLIW